eukprot:98227_1
MLASCLLYRSFIFQKKCLLMHPNPALYQQSQRIPNTEPSAALRALLPDPNRNINNQNRNHNNNINQNGNNKVDASFVTPQSIQQMLKEMNLPSKIDHATAKFYQEVCVLYVKKVFDLAMDYAHQRQSTNIEMKDVLRSIKKYSVVPPNQWNHVKLKGNHPLRKNKNRNIALATHKRRLNIARKNQKIMDKNFNKNK